MSRIIEAKAVITAEDRTGAVFDNIAKKLKGVGKGAKVSADIERLNKTLAQTKQQLEGIDKIKALQSRVSSAKLGLSGVKAEADRIAAAMAAAKRAGDAGVTAGLAKESKAVQRNLAQATAAVERQSAALSAAKRGLNEFGVPITNLVAHERALKGAAEQATSAIRKQTEALSQQDRRERVMERWQARGRDRARAADDRRQAIDDRRRLAADSHGQEYRRHLDRHGVVHAAAAGAAGYVGVHSVAHEIKDTVRAGARYQHEVVALRNAGRTPEEMREIEHASHDATRAVLTATFEENLKVINETTGAFGSLHHAIENLPFMQKSAFALKMSAGDKVHEDAGDLGNKMARFFEMRGTAGNTEVFQKEAGEMIRAMIFTRGNFNPGEMVNFAQQAKSSLPNYSERFMSKIAPSLVTEFGGDRAGTAANAFRGVLMGKANDKKQAEEWVNLGLLDTKQTIMKGGHAVSWKAGAVKDTNLALSDPLQWMEQVMLPAMRKKGVNTDDKLELTKAFGTLFRNSNSNLFAEALGQNLSRNRLHKDEENIIKAGTLDEVYSQNLKSDPTASVKAMTAALENLATAASAPAMETAAGYIKAMAEQMQTLALAAKDHPALAMGGGVAAAGAGLAGAGWMSYQVLNGFGLGKSAVALDGSAVALTEAAAALGGKGLLGGAAGAAANGAGKVGAVGRLGALGALGAAGLGVAAIAAGVYAVDQSLPNNNRMNGNGKGVRSGGAGAYMPGGWGKGYVDVSGGVGAKDGPFVTNRPKTWMDTIFGGQASFRGGRDQTRMELPSMGAGRGAMQMPSEVKLSPDSRLEATVKPDQIISKIESLPPVTGQATVTLDPQRVIVELNSDMLTAKIAGEVARKTAQIPLSSGGRPGAVSMPGAATTPGAAK